jgi:mono/diheme cytochrome c family protein
MKAAITIAMVVACGALGGTLLGAQQPPASTTQPPTTTTEPPTTQPPTTQPPTTSPTATGTSGSSEPKTVWSGVYSDAQAKRGADVYTNKCASCHGPDLTGVDTAPALSGADFNTNWNDLTLNDLFERIHVSMPGDNPGSLSRQEVADVMAFILSRGNFPPGETDLPTQAEMLKEIKFAAAKPQQ